MKKILIVFCILLTAYAVYFPCTYFGSNNDKKEIRVSHIMFDTKEEALKAKEEINNGTTFEEAAKTYNGGDIGYRQRGRLEKNLNDAVFTMKVNEISDPLEGKTAWHLVQVSEIKYYSENENFKYDKYRYLDL